VHVLTGDKNYDIKDSFYAELKSVFDELPHENIKRFLVKREEERYFETDNWE
jgi:hypothetical protein